MRLRPVRAKIYLPIVRFFVVSSDWKFVLGLTLIGYLVPFVLKLRIWVLPVWLFTGVGTLLLSIAFFNYIRIGRRPHWFQHTVWAMFKRPRERRSLPRDSIERPRPLWVIDVADTRQEPLDEEGRSSFERVMTA